MDQVEQPSEKLIQNEREEADEDDEGDRHSCRGHPFFARRPRDAPQFGDHPADEIAAGNGLGRLLLFVHQRLSPEKLAGRTGLEPATGDFGDRCATNCATALRRRLLRFAMGTMATAPTAILIELEPFRRFLLVLLRIVIPAFALGTGQNHHHARFFLRHLGSPA